MFQSYMAVPLHFTIEFLGFLTTAGGAFLVLSKPPLVPGARLNRIVAALGLALLAAAQVLHGGSFIEGDAGEVLMWLRAAGYTFLAASLTLGSPKEKPAAAAALPLGPSLGATAGAATLAGVAIYRWVKGGPLTLIRLAAAALVLAGAEMLMSRSTGAQIGSDQVDSFAYISHGARLAGYLLLASWLWTGVRFSIRARFVASFVALLITVVLALSTALTGVISDNVESAELDRVEEQVAALATGIEEDEIQGLLTQVRLLPQTGEIVDRLNKNIDLPDMARDLVDTGIFTIDFALFRATNTENGFWGRGPARNVKGEPKFGRITEATIIRILGSPVVEEVLGPAEEAASPDQIGDSVALLAAIDVRTVEVGGGREVGTAIIGRWVDALTVEDISNSLAPAEATLVVDGRVAASQIDDITGDEVLPRDVFASLESGDTPSARQQALGGSDYYSGFAPIRRPDGRAVATLVLSSPAEIVEQTRGAVTRTLFLVAMGVGAVALALAWLSGRRITRPIQQLTATARRVREGDLGAKVTVEGVDEVGQLGETFNEMTASLMGMTNDLKEAAKEEYRLRARIETIIESMADGLVAVDADRKVLAFNRQAERLTGLKAKGVIGRPVEEILDVRDPQGEKVALPIFDLVGGSVGGVLIHRKKGEPVPAAITSAILLGEDESIAGAVAVMRDVTREREVERMKSEFLSNISHELRTPLTPIKGYAEILNRKELSPEKTKQFVRGILDSTDRLERIVELLVDFSAMEAGRLAPRSTPVDVTAMLSDLATIWEKKTPRHKVVTDVKARLPRVVGDERLLKRSLEELLDNAVKFSPDGGTITLQAKALYSGNGDAKRRVVAVSVSDEGIGITPNDLGKIFSDFQQLDGSETRSYGGLGLGLAFVRRIVEAHQGTIDVESEPDHGTKLTITIPAIRRPR